MKREKLIQEITEYFTSSDHWRRLVAALQDPDPHGTHIHSYVETCVHPKSLEALITGYMERMGWPSTRRIDHMSPKSGMGSLHGIEPKGKPHFDYQWFFNEEVGLRGTEGGEYGESGCNLLIWNRWYINEFYKDFQFLEVGKPEEKEIRSYFTSDHWKQGLDIARAAQTTHMHINVETSVHPDVIGRFAREALEVKGWKIDYICPNVYLVGGRYRGKLVFMGRDPEEVYDIGWHFNPDVILEPTKQQWIFPDNIGYDVWSKKLLDEVMNAPYVKLTAMEISQILDAC